MVRVSEEQLKILRERYAKNKAHRESLPLPRIQPRHPDVSDISYFKKQFKDQDVYIIGSGPSLYGIDWEVFKDKKTICINNTIKWFKNPTVHIFLDMQVLKEGGRSPGIPIVTKIGNFVPDHTGPVYKIRVGRNLNSNPEANGFYSAFSTGHIAIHFAIHCGAKRIFILGMEKGFLDNDQFKQLKGYMDASPWHKTHHDILEQKAKCEKRGYQMGHFYSQEMRHTRDNGHKSYNSAGERLTPFYDVPEIYQLTPVHFTEFPFKDIKDI
jgi:hypothetical protein